MEHPRVALHAAALGLESTVLLALIDAQRAFNDSCVWCGTPPLPPEPMLPADFWLSVFGFLLPPPQLDAYCIVADLEGPLVVVGALLATHLFALFALSGGRRTSRP